MILTFNELNTLNSEIDFFGEARRAAWNNSSFKTLSQLNIFESKVFLSAS
jgi:hypothetical protein